MHQRMNCPLHSHLTCLLLNGIDHQCTQSRLPTARQDGDGLDNDGFNRLSPTLFQDIRDRKQESEWLIILFGNQG